MIRMLTISVLATALSLAAAADANAWTRKGTWTGPHGTSSVYATGSCANGSCTRQITRTGPNGNSVVRNGSLTCGGGTCNGTSTATGPRGKSVTRSGTWIWN
jgi:hypothetical protein